MPVEGDLVYRPRAVITSELIANFQGLMPNANLGEDTVLRILMEVFGGGAEGLYLAVQLLANNMFVPTMDRVALLRAGDERGVPTKAGTQATGILLFSGLGGTTIEVGTQAGAPQTVGDTLVFNTTQSAMIPSPGTATAPVATNLSSGNVTGTVEWAATFLTLQGETSIGEFSNVLTLTSRTAHLASIPLGGPGTIARRIYRLTDGGPLKFVAEINDNTTTTYDDNIAFGSLGGPPPDASTAERVAVPASAAKVGTEYNVDTGTITTLLRGVAGLSDIGNPEPFSGGSNAEDTEAFRTRVLEWIRNPWSGSLEDLEALAESVQGVAQATGFKNEPQLGHVTIRIAGPGGVEPNADTQAAVLALLDNADLANVVVHVDLFDSFPIDVDVSLTLDPAYSIDDVRPSVEQAISGYIDSVPVGDVFHTAGVYRAVYGLPGVVTLLVTAPPNDIPLDAHEKAVAGVLTVT